MLFSKSSNSHSNCTAFIFIFTAKNLIVIITKIIFNRVLLMYMLYTIVYIGIMVCVNDLSIFYFAYNLLVY